MFNEILNTLIAWQEEGKDYIAHHSYQAITVEIISKFRAWGEEDCPHRTMANLDGEGDVSLIHKSECPQCWEELESK